MFKLGDVGGINKNFAVGLPDAKIEGGNIGKINSLQKLIIFSLDILASVKVENYTVFIKNSIYLTIVRVYFKSKNVLMEFMYGEGTCERAHVFRGSKNITNEKID